jgi:hypothetical protein
VNKRLGGPQSQFGRFREKKNASIKYNTIQYKTIQYNIGKGYPITGHQGPEGK